VTCTRGAGVGGPGKAASGTFRLITGAMFTYGRPATDAGCNDLLFPADAATFAVYHFLIHGGILLGVVEVP